MIEINNKKHPDMEGLSFCLKSIGKYRHDTRNHIRHHECSINPHYLKDLDDSFDVTISKDQTDPVLFENGNKSAAIMLMRPQGI